MTVFGMLHKLILGPIELLFDVIFSFSLQFLGSPVLAIVILSLAINLLVLPLYKDFKAPEAPDRPDPGGFHRGRALHDAPDLLPAE